jgi:proline dehydrogenase
MLFVCACALFLSFSYHAVVSTLLSHTPQAHFMVASHNETTVQFVTQAMKNSGRPRSGGGVYFGQLLGMCDHVSFSLGRCGFQCYKYVPYGPIHDVIPYLIRRAEENSDLLGGATKERRLLWQEIKRRYRVKIGMEKATAKK